MAFNFETVVQIILLMIALRLLHMVSARDSCSDVRRNFGQKRIGPLKLVPFDPHEAKDLRVCSNSGLTCCNRQMETRFQAAATKDVQNVLKYKTSSLRFNFRSFTENFQDDVIELISSAKNLTKDLLRRSMRKKTNKKVLEHTMGELERLFKVLKLGAEPEEIKLAFARFADKLFLATLDGTYNVSQPDNAYEKCVNEQRVDLHPFMDVPTISAANLSSALLLAQTLHEALDAGAEAVNVTEGSVLTSSCQRSLLRMQYCSHCFALTLLKPCMGLCRNVLRGCFAGVSEMDQYWNYYVGALVDVTKRMREPESKYNLEIALGDFRNQLSSSFAVLWENITALQETVEKRCRKSRTLKRSKRSADFPQMRFLDDEDAAKPNEGNEGKRRRRQGRKGTRGSFRSKGTRELLKLKEEILPRRPILAIPHPRVRPPHEVLFTSQNRERKEAIERVVEARNSGNLHTRIRRFIVSLNLSINFYRHLPDDMCEPRPGVTIEVVSHGKCWDGSDIVDQYPKDVIAPGFEEQAANPEVNVLKVEKGVMRAIERLRNTAKFLLLAAGKKEIPGILLRAPVFRKREDQRKERMKSPCDDEDDCDDTMEGSGDEFDRNRYPVDDESTRTGRRKRPPLVPFPENPQGGDENIVIGDDDLNLYNDTDIFEMMRRKGEEAEKDRKRPPNRKREKNKNGRKNKSNTPTEKTAEITTTGGASTGAVSSHLLLAFWISIASVIISTLGLN